MAQVSGMFVPPVYIIYSVVRRRFDVRRLMRISGASLAVGASLGAGVGYRRLSNEPEIKIIDRVERLVNMDTTHRHLLLELLSCSLTRSRKTTSPRSTVMSGLPSEQPLAHSLHPLYS